MPEEKRILTMLVNNVPGVTARVAGLFASRNYNIENFCGAPTVVPGISRITITTRTPSEQMEQVMKQIRKLIDVVKLRDMTGEEAVKRELALIYIDVPTSGRDELFRLMDMFGAKLAHAGKSAVIVEITDSEEKISAFIDHVRPMGIRKISRSGTLALYKDDL